MPADYVEFRLRFVSPLRVGTAHWESTQFYPRLHSDLLYRALAHAYAELNGRPVDDALPGGAYEPRLRLSSALPYTSDLGALAPTPTTWTRHDCATTLVAMERGEAVALPLGSAERGTPWVTTKRSHAQFDRRNARRAVRYETSEVRFVEGAGLWIGVRFADAATDRAPFEAALAYLGESGIGGGRSVGCGRFDVAASQTRTVSDLAAAQALWVLSRYRPSETEFGNGSLVSESAAIWDVWSAPNGREALRFLAEGSVVTRHDGLDVDTAGTVLEIARPTSAGTPSDARPMVRSGLLFALPVPAEPPAAVDQAPPPIVREVAAPKEPPAGAAEPAKPEAAAPRPAPAPAPGHQPETKTLRPPGAADEPSGQPAPGGRSADAAKPTSEATPAEGQSPAAQSPSDGEEPPPAESV